MKTHARPQFQKQVSQRNTFIWGGVFATWLFLMLFIAMVFGYRAIENTFILLFVFYLIIVGQIVLVTVAISLDRWTSKPHAIKCPQCAGNIVPDAKWTCGYCGKFNESQPLLGFCEHCHEAPASVLCPRDSYVIQLDEQRSTDSNHAVTEATSVEITDTSPIDEILERKSKLEAETQAIKAETARLQALAARKQAEGQLKDVEPASIDARLQHLLALKLELPDAKNRIIQELQDKYADDPDNLRAALGNLDSVIDDILNSEIAR